MDGLWSVTMLMRAQVSLERPIERCLECGNVVKFEYVGPEVDPHARMFDSLPPVGKADWVGWFANVLNKQMIMAMAMTMVTDTILPMRSRRLSPTSLSPIIGIGKSGREVVMPCRPACPVFG